jgi:hypothetical protein
MRAKGHADLFRGDDKDAVAVPIPSAQTRIVEHILYLGGRGRPTPFSSTSQSEETAKHFAGSDGAIWTTKVDRARAEGAVHISHSRLLADLKGRGRGECGWTSAWEVATARGYVEQWQEHLLDWRPVRDEDAAGCVQRTFMRK